MRILDILEHTVPISRYADADVPSGGLTTSVVALVTDVVRDGQAVIGYGFSSIGRYGQGGLIAERFAPRIMSAPPADLSSPGATNIDPFRVWATMMTGEKPGGHGDRCVAVGTLDMAVWDLASKIANLPLHRYLSARAGRAEASDKRIKVYAAGGYPYPVNDIGRLVDEIREFVGQGYAHVKIKIGSKPIAQDLERVEAALWLLPDAAHLAVDAMYAYDLERGLAAAAALQPLGLWWFEDICDPLDFDTLAATARAYAPPIAAGEALFSLAEAKLLNRHGGLRPTQDILLFDPVHCYGLTHYLSIVENLEAAGWPRRAFWPHGGHLFSQHIVLALGLGGAEVNPLCFQPFGGLADGAAVEAGWAALGDAPGIGFEMKTPLIDLLRASLHS